MQTNLLLLLPITIYTILILYIHFKTNKHSDNGDSGYFLAKNKIRSFSSVLSIAATETSVATIIIFPAVGMSSGLSLIWLSVGYVLGRLIVASIYLNKLYSRHKLSIYKTMSGESILSKRFLESFYLLAKFLSSGVRFFMAGYALNQLFGGSIIIWILVTAFIVGIYSLRGGLKSVVATDIVQFFIILVMGIFILVILAKGLNFSSIPAPALMNTDFNIHNSMFYLALLFGGIVISIGSHGADQDIIQRILGTKSLKSAQKSLFISGIIASLIILLYLAIGFLLKQHNLVLDTKSPLTDYISSQNPLFIGSFGVLLFAAAMSTLDSAVHSTGAIWKSLFHSKRSGWIWSFLSLIMLVIFAFGFIWLQKFQTNFLSLAMGAMNYVNGGLIAIFTVFTFAPKYVRSTGLIMALISGFLTTYILTWVISPSVAWSWTIIISSTVASISCIIGTSIQLFILKKLN